MRIALFPLLLCLSGAGFAQQAESVKVLASFDTLDGWTASAADGVTVSIKPDAPEGSQGKAMRIDFDFTKGSGFCIVHAPMPMTLPENYEILFRVRGECPPNNFEIKLIDGSLHGAASSPSGDDVWWVNQRGFVFPNSWQTVRLKKRKFAFAWGPGGGNTPLTKLGAMEFAIAAAQGGKGSVWIDLLAIRELPVVKAYTGTPKGSASSKMCEMHDPTNLFDNDPATAWESDADDAAPTYTIDFGESREFGGLAIQWEKKHAPSAVTASLSEDGINWIPSTELIGVNEDRAFVAMPDAQGKFVKLAFKAPAKGVGVGMQTIEVLGTDFSSSPNEFMKAVATRYPQGMFPKYVSEKQTYWTIAGIPGDLNNALVNEEGMVELGKGEFSLDPFIIKPDGTVLTWANGTHTQELAAGVTPIPIIARKLHGQTLIVTSYVEGRPLDSVLHVCYEVRASDDAAVKGTLVIAARPFQVLPTWQRLNMDGGVAPIATVARDGNTLIVNRDRRIAFHTAPAAMRAATFDSAPCPYQLTEAKDTLSEQVTDPTGRASALVYYPYEIKAGEVQRWWVSTPINRGRSEDRLAALATNADAKLSSGFSKSVESWARIVGKVPYTVPPLIDPWKQTYFSQIAYILANSRGPALQPGSRTYDRTWIRDGNSIAAAMLESGNAPVARNFIEWYAKYQYENGKIPCVVDSRGPDPVPENDSTGQYINAVMTYHRFVHDESFLRSQYAGVSKAVGFINSMRAQRLTAEFGEGGPARKEQGKPAVPALAFRGLVPESISHEGYSAKPMHSYWDDIWAWRGLHDAAEIAKALKEQTDATAWSAAAEEMGKSLGASIALAQKAHGIDYVPGCVELGDFDSTSTSIALWPCQAERYVPLDGLKKTMSKSWMNFVSRRDDPSFEWRDYTPYEIRHIPALLAIGERDHALDMIAWHMEHRRPKGFNHWAEVVWKDEHSPKFIGDMPHNWVGAEYVHAWRNLFAFENESDQSLVVMAGVPASWFQRMDAGPPVAVVGLPTWYGPINISAHRAGEPYVVNLSGQLDIPSGGIVVRTVSDKAIRSVTVNGQPAELNAIGQTVVRELPAEVRFLHY